PGVRDGEILALGTFDARVAGRAERTARREIPEYVLFPVWPSLYRRPRTLGDGGRTAVHDRRHHSGGRAALGWAGALHALSGFPQVRLLHAGFWRRCALGRPASYDLRFSLQRI